MLAPTPTIGLVIRENNWIDAAADKVYYWSGVSLVQELVFLCHLGLKDGLRHVVSSHMAEPDQLTPLHCCKRRFQVAR